MNPNHDPDNGEFTEGHGGGGSGHSNPKKSSRVGYYLKAAAGLGAGVAFGAIQNSRIVRSAKLLQQQIQDHHDNEAIKSRLFNNVFNRVVGDWVAKGRK